MRGSVPTLLLLGDEVRVIGRPVHHAHVLKTIVRHHVVHRVVGVKQIAASQDRHHGGTPQHVGGAERQQRDECLLELRGGETALALEERKEPFDVEKDFAVLRKAVDIAGGGGGENLGQARWVYV